MALLSRLRGLVVPGAVLLVLGLVSLATLKLRRNPVEEPPPPLSDEDRVSIYTGFERIVYDLETGQVRLEVKARSAELINLGEEYRLEDIYDTRVHLDQGRVLVLEKARFGQFWPEARDLRLSQGLTSHIEDEAGEVLIEFEGEELRYSGVLNELTVGGPIRLSSADMKTVGEWMHVWVGDEVLVLRREIETIVHRLPSLDADPEREEVAQRLGSEPLRITADSLRFWLDTRIAEYRSDPLLQLGKSRLKADSVRFFLDPKENRAELEGHVSALLDGGEMESSALVAADTLDVMGSSSTVVFTGHVRATDGSFVARARRAEALLEPDGAPPPPPPRGSDLAG